MPFIILLIGLVILLAAYNRNLSDLGTLLKNDVMGEGAKPGFVYWIITIGVLGGLGYIKPIRPLTNAFLGLVILVLFLSNGGFFDQFNQAIKSITSGSQQLPVGKIDVGPLNFSDPNTGANVPVVGPTQ